MAEYDFLQRTAALLGESTVTRFSGSTVAVAGLGGVGGAVAITLARLGLGGLIIADPGSYDLPDLNRQTGAAHSTLGRNKAEVTALHLDDINPRLRLRTFTAGLNEANLGEFLEDADLVVDALDLNVSNSLRLALYEGIKRRGIPVILPPIVGFSAVVSVSDPRSMTMEPVLLLLAKAARQGTLPPGLHRILDLQLVACMEAHMRQGIVPSLAIGPSVAAGAVATEVLMILCQEKPFPGWRPPVVLPNMLVVDLLRLQCTVMTVDEMAS